MTNLKQNWPMDLEICDLIECLLGEKKTFFFIWIDTGVFIEIDNEFNQFLCHFLPGFFFGVCVCASHKSE